MVVLVADLGVARTVLPSVARTKNTRFLLAPLAKFFPFRTSVPPTGTWAGENDVTVGRGVAARAALANTQSARRARTDIARRRRMKASIGQSQDGFSEESL